MILRASSILIALYCLTASLRADNVKSEAGQKTLAPFNVGQFEAVQTVFSAVIEKLDSAIDEAEAEYQRFLKMYDHNRQVAGRWSETPSESTTRSVELSSKASNLLYFVRVMASIETTKYSVTTKTLKSTLERVKSMWRQNLNGLLIDFGQGNLMPVDYLNVFVARAIARAIIEADRQSQQHYNWLYLLIENHRKEGRISEFNGLDSKAIYDLKSLRLKAQHLHKVYEEIKKRTFKLLRTEPSSYDYYLNHFDSMIEQEVGCVKCHKYPESPDYYNTRPLFENQATVKETIRQSIDEIMFKKLNEFADENSNWYVQRNIPKFSEEEKNSVKLTNIRELIDAPNEVVHFLYLRENILESIFRKIQNRFDEFESLHSMAQKSSYEIASNEREAYEQAIIRINQKLVDAIDLFEKGFENFKEVYAQILFSIDQDWRSDDESYQDSVRDLRERADAMMFIEAIKYSVAKKILESSKTILIQSSHSNGTSSSAPEGKVLMPAEFVPIFFNYLIARANIEVDRQSDEQWKWLYLMIARSRSIEEFWPHFYHVKLMDVAIRRLRALYRERDQFYGLAERESLRLFDTYPSLAKDCLKKFDLLIERAIGCIECQEYPESEEYYNTRPLFMNQDAINEVILEMVDQDMKYQYATRRLRATKSFGDYVKLDSPKYSYHKLKFPVHKQWRFSDNLQYFDYEQEAMLKVTAADINELIKYPPSRPSAQIINEHLKKVNSVAKQLEINFNNFKEYFYEPKQGCGDRIWPRISHSGQADNFDHYIEVLALFEAIKFSVSNKILESTRKLLSTNMQINGDTVSFEDRPSQLPVQFLEIIVDRAIARASIEADRQTRELQNRLYLLGKHCLKYEDRQKLTEIVTEGCELLHDLRKNVTTTYSNYVDTKLKVFVNFKIKPSVANYFLDDLDKLIETAAGCTECHAYSKSPEFFNTRPLFDTQAAVEASLSQIKDKEFVETLSTVKNINWWYYRFRYPSALRVGKEGMSKVTHKDINSLLEELGVLENNVCRIYYIPRGKPNKRC